MYFNVALFPAKQAVSPTDVLAKLEEFGLPSSADTRLFSQEVFARVPRKATGVNVGCYFLVHIITVANVRYFAIKYLFFHQS